MTWQEIERRIHAGSLTDKQQAELWNALFLTLPEIDELLAHVRSVARQPWIYPMFVFAAHTGARRSEMLRAEVADVDFEERNDSHSREEAGKGATNDPPCAPDLPAL